MTLREIRDLIAVQLGDPGFLKYAPSYIDAVVNMGESFIATHTLCLRQIWVHPTYEGQADYNLANIGGTGANKCLAVSNVLYGKLNEAGNEIIRWDSLDLRDFWEQDKLDSKWRTAKPGVPDVAIIWGNFLWLHPAPNKNSGSIENLKVEICALPIKKEANQDALQIPESLKNDLLNYGLSFIKQDMKSIYAMEGLLKVKRPRERGKVYYLRSHHPVQRWI